MSTGAKAKKSPLATTYKMLKQDYSAAGLKARADFLEQHGGNLHHVRILREIAEVCGLITQAYTEHPDHIFRMSKSLSKSKSMTHAVSGPNFKVFCTLYPLTYNIQFENLALGRLSAVKKFSGAGATTEKYIKKNIQSAIGYGYWIRHFPANAFCDQHTSSGIPCWVCYQCIKNKLIEGNHEELGIKYDVIWSLQY